MLIGNRLNPDSVINTELVTDYFKGKMPNHAKPYTICFGFPGGTSDEQIYVEWFFEMKEDRDAQWNNLMGAMSVHFFDQPPPKQRDKL